MFPCWCFDAAFNNIAVIFWRAKFTNGALSVNDRHVNPSRWQTCFHIQLYMYQVHLARSRIELTLYYFHTLFYCSLEQQLASRHTNTSNPASFCSSSLIILSINDLSAWIDIHKSNLLCFYIFVCSKIYQHSWLFNKL